MNIEIVETSRVFLDGDWSMNGVAEKFPILANYLAGVFGAETSVELQNCPSKSIPEIDLTGITDFDACGCQLLALFISNLKRNGVTVHLINMSDALRSKINFLGFGRELNLPL